VAEATKNKKSKEGRHVGLDFYDLLREALIENPLRSGHCIFALGSGKSFGSTSSHHPGNERSVMVGEEGAVVLEKVEEVGHLLEVGGNVRVITGEMDVVEMYIDDVLDSAPPWNSGSRFGLAGPR
jgi:hypothetical protein